MIERFLIAILTLVILAQAITMPPSVAQDAGTIPPCATTTRRPTRTPTPEATPTVTPTPTQGIGEPAYLGYNWLVPVGGQP